MILGIESLMTKPLFLSLIRSGFLGEWAQSDRKPCGLWRGGAGFGRQRTLGRFLPRLGQGPIRNAGEDFQNWYRGTA